MRAHNNGVCVDIPDARAQINAHAQMQMHMRVVSSPEHKPHGKKNMSDVTTMSARIRAIIRQICLRPSLDLSISWTCEAHT
jgi:hypothetical protein